MSGGRTRARTWDPPISAPSLSDEHGLWRDAGNVRDLDVGQPQRRDAGSDGPERPDLVVADLVRCPGWLLRGLKQQ